MVNNTILYYSQALNSLTIHDDLIKDKNKLNMSLYSVFYTDFEIEIGSIDICLFA